MGLFKRHPLLTLFLVIGLSGPCACQNLRTLSMNGKRPPAVVGENMAVVTVAEQDSFASLAQTYLDDAGKAWWISTFNDIQTLTPGDRVLIPTRPFRPGGVYANGYQTVPVLRYSTVAAKPGDQAAVSANAFGLHLDYLKSEGFVSISLDQFSAFLELTDQVPPKSVLICLDSGDSSLLNEALPLLRQHGMTAALFVATGRIGQTGLLSWDQLARLKAQGFSIGTTGVTGEEMDAIKPGETQEAYLKRVSSELRQAADALRLKLNQTSAHFAYPGGKANDLLTALLKMHGYRTAFTRQQGANPFFVNSFRIHGAKVTGQWDLARLRDQVPTFQQADLR